MLPMQLSDAIATLPECIRRHVIKKNIAPAETILLKGSEVSHVYILLQGFVRVSNDFINGHRYSFAEFGPPSLIGEVEVLAGQSRSAATVEAITACRILSLPAETFLNWLRGDVELALLMARLVAAKFYPTSNNNGTIKFIPALQKMESYLLQTYGSTASGSTKFILHKGRQQIADEIGTSIKTVNRCANELKAAGFITLLHGKITINPAQRQKLYETFTTLSQK